MKSPPAPLSNPFRPGAGHMPPFLAGREADIAAFGRLLEQREILDNLVLTGLRGVGKTVLLDTFRPRAIREGWSWVGTDISEAASIDEEAVATRLIADLAAVTAHWTAGTRRLRAIGFESPSIDVPQGLGYAELSSVFKQTPGLISDKLRAVLDVVRLALPAADCRGIVFAYDEAQNLADHDQRRQYPLSLLLDVFQSVQRRGAPFLLVLAGLPPLFPKLVEARTFAERMFHVQFLSRLDDVASRQAIERPIAAQGSPVAFDSDTVDLIVQRSAGYPYFIQFICREAFDIFIERRRAGRKMQAGIDDIIRKLDQDFFAGRWGRVTDRQRDMLMAISRLESADDEFTVQEVVTASREALERGFSPSHANQMLSALIRAGLVYKNRHGKYSFAVPLFASFVRRQTQE